MLHSAFSKCYTPTKAKLKTSLSYLCFMQEQPLIIYDGVCGLCNRSVHFIIRRDSKKQFKFLPLQSNKAIALMHAFGVDLHKSDSIILLDHNKLFTHSDAVLLALKKLNSPVRWLYIFIIVPRFIRNAVYRLIAKNRYRWFGRFDSCPIPDASIKDRFLSD